MRRHDNTNPNKAPESTMLKKNERDASKLKDWIKIYEKSGYTLSSQNRYGN